VNQVLVVQAGDSQGERGPIYHLRVEDFADGATLQFDGGSPQPIYALGVLHAPPCRPWRSVKVSAGALGVAAVRLSSDEDETLDGAIARKGQRYGTVALANNANVPLAAPAAAGDGYALAPSMTALRFTFRDNASARSVVKWLQSSAGTWMPAGSIATTPGQEVVFEVGVPVGVGRVYLQCTDVVGALAADVDAEVVS
jgi:hypothetical protein